MTPSGPAGGDLAGFYPNPTVPGLADLQAQIDALAPTYSGNPSLDDSAQATVTTPTPTGALVASFADPTGVGPLSVERLSSSSYLIVSAAGATDNEKAIFWIAY